MASGALLAALAMGPRVSIAERAAEGQERGLRLDEILRSNEARQYAPAAMNHDRSALATIMGLDPKFGMEINRQLEGQADRDEDRAWRRDQASQAQKNSDRAYQLDLQQFGLAQANANWQRRAKEAEAPDLVEMYDDPTGQPYKAQWNPKTSTFDRVGGVKAPSGTQLDVTLPDGTVIRQGAQKNLTEGQSKDLVYLTRMADAVPIIDQMGDQLLSLGENVGGNVPVIGNYLKSPEYQQAEQAAGQWRQGFLRKDSGATITDDEKADTNRLYIPQPGDKTPVLRQKAQARRMATLAVKMGLPPQAVMEMQKNGIDLDKILKAPLPSGGGNSGGKSDKAGAPPNRTQNGINWSID